MNAGKVLKTYLNTNVGDLIAAKKFNIVFD
jgi:hypothetical protein